MPATGPSEQDAYYRTRFTALAARDGAWRVICQYLQRFVPRDAAVLDLGAGYCTFINNIEAAEKHALDAYGGFGAHAGPEVQTHVGVCTNLGPFRDAQFAVVFASNLLEHLSRDELAATLAEVTRVLEHGGRLILIQPNYRYCASEYFDDYTHQSIFSHVSLPDVLESAGFVVEEVQARFLPLTFKSRFPAWPWMVSLYLRLPIRPFGKQMLVVARR